MSENSINKILKTLRKELGLDQKEMAKLINPRTTLATYSNWEEGTTKPNAQNIIRIMQMKEEHRVREITRDSGGISFGQIRALYKQIKEAHQDVMQSVPSNGKRYFQCRAEEKLRNVLKDLSNLLEIEK